jgi:uncharacterized protein YoaH (UPF0181 family)
MLYMQKLLSLFTGLLVLNALQAAVPLTEAKFTQVINDVKVVGQATKAVHAARLADAFRTPDLLRTGTDSLAELTANDHTITRVGANTIFSFETKGRSINLQQGSVLFHSPKGKGGGTIRTGGASASVLGTTLIVSTTTDGGFKAIVLEGKGQVRLPNGDFRVLDAGQMVLVLPGAPRFGPLLHLNLEKLVKSARLVSGFQSDLPSKERVEEAVERQQELFAKGYAEDTEVEVVDRFIRGRHEAEEERASNLGNAEQAVTESPLMIALRTDATILNGGLDPAHVFLQFFDVQLGGSSGFSGQVRGFAARNISITATLVDMASHTSSGLGGFTFFASERLETLGDVSFTGTSAPGAFELSLLALGEVRLADNSLVEANGVGNLGIKSVEDVKFDAVTLKNYSGSFELVSLGSIEIKDSLAQGSSLKVQAAADLQLENASFTLQAGGVGTPYQVSLQTGGASPATTTTKMELIDVTLTGLGATSSARLISGLEITAENLSFANFGTIALEARTLVLENVDFPAGSAVSLKSQLGLLAPNPNTGSSVQVGFVNYIDNVRYNGSLLSATPHPNITISPLP